MTMSAMTFSTGPDLDDAGASLAKLRAKFGPLAMVLAAHALLFYFIYSGMLTRMVDAAVPQAVLVTFVAPPAPPKASTPPAAPKTVAITQQKPPELPSVPVVQVQLTPPPNTISVTQAPPPAEKAPVAAVAAPAPAAAAPKTITTGIEYILPPQTVYPQMSKRMGEQGKVVLRILVGENGKPDQVQVQTSSGFSRLDEAGRQAGLRVLFKPHMEDGRAVPVYVILPLNFQLTS
jgi:protein TonB